MGCLPKIKGSKEVLSIDTIIMLSDLVRRQVHYGIMPKSVFIKKIYRYRLLLAYNVVIREGTKTAMT